MTAHEGDPSLTAGWLVFRRWGLFIKGRDLGSATGCNFRLVIGAEHVDDFLGIGANLGKAIEVNAALATATGILALNQGVKILAGNTEKGWDGSGFGRALEQEGAKAVGGKVIEVDIAQACRDVVLADGADGDGRIGNAILEALSLHLVACRVDGVISLRDSEASFLGLWVGRKDDSLTASVVYFRAKRMSTSFLKKDGYFSE